MRKIPLIAVGLSACSIPPLSQGDPVTGKMTRGDNGLEIIGATQEVPMLGKSIIDEVMTCPCISSWNATSNPM
jgi:hypothetical protein